MNLKLSNIFCELDDFTQAFNKKMAEYLLEKSNPKSVHRPELDGSEMMCIAILYDHSGYKCFQYYYEQEAEKGYLKTYFPQSARLQTFSSVKAPAVAALGGMSKQANSQ